MDRFLKFLQVPVCQLDKTDSTDSSVQTFFRSNEKVSAEGTLSKLPLGLASLVELSIMNSVNNGPLLEFLSLSPWCTLVFSKPLALGFSFTQRS